MKEEAKYKLFLKGGKMNHKHGIKIIEHEKK